MTKKQTFIIKELNRQARKFLEKEVRYIGISNYKFDNTNRPCKLDFYIDSSDNNCYDIGLTKNDQGKYKLNKISNNKDGLKIHNKLKDFLNNHFSFFENYFPY